MAHFETLKLARPLTITPAPIPTSLHEPHNIKNPTPRATPCEPIRANPHQDPSIPLACASTSLLTLKSVQFSQFSITKPFSLAKCSRQMKP